MTGAGQTIGNKIAGRYARPLRRTGLWGVAGGGPGEIRQRAAADRPSDGDQVQQLGGLEPGGSRRRGRIEENQALSGSALGVVARAPSHGEGQGVDPARHCARCRLIANLTDGAGLAAELGQTGGRVAVQAGANLACARPIERPEWPLPPFAAASSASEVASGRPGHHENRLSTSIRRRSPAAAPCSIGPSGREPWQPPNGSGPRRFFHPMKTGSGVRSDRARRTVRRSGDQAGCGVAGGVNHGRVRPFVERIGGGYASRRAGVNRPGQIPVDGAGA